MVLNHEPRLVSQHEEIPPAEIARQHQAWIPRAETGRCQRLGQETTRPNQKPQVPSQRKTKAGPDGSENQQAPRLALLPNEDGALPDRTILGLDNRHLLVVPVQHPDPGAPLQELPPMEKPAEDLWTTGLEETRKLPGPTRARDRTSIAKLLADERCSQTVLQFFATTDVGRTSGPPVAEDDEDAASEASEWEARDQAERAWEIFFFLFVHTRMRPY